jgi:hypothetical protein
MSNLLLIFLLWNNCLQQRGSSIDMMPGLSKTQTNIKSNNNKFHYVIFYLNNLMCVPRVRVRGASHVPDILSQEDNIKLGLAHFWVQQYIA